MKKDSISVKISKKLQKILLGSTVLTTSIFINPLQVVSAPLNTETNKLDVKNNHDIKTYRILSNLLLTGISAKTHASSSFPLNPLSASSAVFVNKRNSDVASPRTAFNSVDKKQLAIKLSNLLANKEIIIDTRVSTNSYLDINTNMINIAKSTTATSDELADVQLNSAPASISEETLISDECFENVKNSQIQPNNQNAVYNKDLITYNHLMRGNAIKDSSLAYGFQSTASGTSSIVVGAYATSGNTNNAVAIGYYSSVTADQSIAVGTESSSSKKDSVAIGYNAQTTAPSAVSLGAHARAAYENSVAIGTRSITSDKDEVSFGNSTVKRRLTNVAGGIKDSDAATYGQLRETVQNILMWDNITRSYNAKNKRITNLANGVMENDAATYSQLVALTYSGSSKKEGTLAFGRSAIAEGARTTVIGVEAEAKSANNAVAVGFKAYAIADGSVAIGARSGASKNNSIAIGYNSIANADDSIALGAQAKALRNNSIAIGYNSVASADNVVSFGSLDIKRKLVNVSAGTNDTDAATYGQLKNAVSDILTAAGSPGFNARNKNISNIAAGKQGSDAATYGQLMYGNATGQDSLAYGDKSIAAGKRSTVVGVEATSGNTDDAVAIGYKANAGYGAVAVGSESQSTGRNSIALGYKSKSSMDDAISLGAYAHAKHKDSVAIGSHSTTGANNVVSFGSQNIKRKLVNVAAGTNDTDAATIANLNEKFANTIKLENNYFNAKDNKISNLAAGTNDTDAVTYGQLMYGNATGQDSLAYGDKSIAAGKRSTVVGVEATSGNTDDAVAIGYKANAGYGAVAVGSESQSTGRNSIALGYKSKSSMDDAISLGAYAHAKHKDSVAIGSHSTTGANNVVSFGSQNIKRKLVNVAAGTNDTDAATIANLNEKFANTIKLENNYFNAKDNKISNLAAGTNDTDAVTYGQLMYGNATGQDSLAYGDKSIAAGKRSTVVGVEATSGNTDDAVAIGYKANATTGAVAVGSESQSTGRNSIALGYKSKSSMDDAISLGAFATATHKNSIAIGSLSTTQAENEVSFGSQNIKRKLVNVAAGTNDTDALTYGQFKEQIGKVLTLNDKSFFNAKDNKISNLAAGTNDTDAVTYGQLMYGNATGQDSLAYGDKSIATGKRSTVVGVEATSGNTDDAVAIGYKANATTGAVAVGSESQSTGRNSIALGYKSNFDRWTTL
ncbi:hypothetical protein [Bartonella sp. DGB1]|uniref:hypothetical protein n=1 Tax=Bartonella sp. DGB1 TaxID=3239807 RepID=UPI003526C0B3